MVTEIWKRIEDYPNYEVSNLGNVRSIDHCTTQINNGTTVNSFYKGKEVSKTPVGRGYLRVVLHKEGKSTGFLVHRLVGKAFIENPNEYPCINHKDGNKKNNSVDNLEWCTYSQNMAYNYKIGISKPLQTDAQITAWSNCQTKAYNL